MRRRAPRAIALAIGLGLAGAASAVEPPAPKGHVNDLAGVLSGDEIRRLEDDLRAHREATGQEFALLIVPSLDGEPIEDLTIRTVERWGLGRKGRDDGLLMLVAIADRKIRIEVGYGLEGAIPDVVASRVIRNLMVPRFRAGDYAGGIAAAFDELRSRGRGEAGSPALDRDPRTLRERLGGLDPGAVFGVAMTLLVIVGFVPVLVGMGVGYLWGWPWGIAVFLIMAILRGLWCARRWSRLGLGGRVWPGGFGGWFGGGGGGGFGRGGGFGGFGGSGGFGGGGASGGW